jgi:hypothetical protein
MGTEMIKLSEIKSNPNNPRVIKDDKFKKLVKSIKDFPKMMELRPMVVNSDNIVLGGNMRLKALKELGYKEVPDEWVKRAEDLTEDEQRQFIIKDNIGFGEHDWEMLQAEWDLTELEEWGLDLPMISAEIEAIEIGDDFIDEFEKQEKPTHPIATDVGECHELFMIPVNNKIDENYIREIFNLKETKQSKLIKGKSNVVNINDIKCALK